MWLDDSGKKRPAVVQRYDPVQRIVDIRFSDTAETETVSVLEVEHGADTHEEYGAGVGEYVFICNDSGSPMPYVPAIGLGLTHNTDPIAILKQMIEAQTSLVSAVRDWAGARIEPNDVEWFGVVVSLEMDGRVGVRLANGKTITVELKNILLLRSMGEDGMIDSEYADSEMDYDDPMPPPSAFAGSMDTLTQIVLANARRQRASQAAEDGASDASWETEYSDNGGDHWDDSSQDAEMLQSLPPNAPLRQITALFRPVGDAMDQIASTPPVLHSMELDNASEDADWVDESIEMAPSSPPTRQSRSPSPPLKDESTNQAGPSSSPRDTAWEPFTVLETAPSDHRFFGEAPASSSRARMKKINAEHKALRSSLPGKYHF
jgi:ubiquitin-conjugating enzyme E2 O